MGIFDFLKGKDIDFNKCRECGEQINLEFKICYTCKNKHILKEMLEYDIDGIVSDILI